MKNITYLISVVGQYHQHVTALLSLLVGFIIIRKSPLLFFGDDELAGDNIPVTLMELLRR